MPLHAVMDNPDSARTAWNRLPSLTSIDASLLPDSARQIAEVIGLPQTLALVSRSRGLYPARAERSQQTWPGNPAAGR